MKPTVFALALAAGVLSLGAGVFAAGSMAKLSGKPAPGELAFVQSVTKDLNARFPTPAKAEKAGYFRFNNEDNTGAISYVNLNRWNSKDPQHPAQLWYDVHGKLLGADYSRPLTASAPHLWGVNPKRWYKFGKPHVHYMLKMPNGMIKYGLAVSGKAFTKAGGDLSDPEPTTIVKLGKAKSVAEVAKVFTYPAMWDLELWVTPNPDGAFAPSDPLIHPTKKASSGMM